ncbi:MAG: hypothetical protein M1834_001701 [Cirrosporium novae-zelandiae]|nr:MAG: hypothetical protein M1834_001701 [Cirrosporium novae-zelandiae]
MRLLGGNDLYILLRALTSENCQRLLHALENELGIYSTPTSPSKAIIHQPSRTSITTKQQHTTLFMPASDTSSTGIKIITLPGQGGTAEGVINIFASEGKILGLLAASEITAFRTALNTMILFTRSPLTKKHLVVFGSGKQAEWHIRLALQFGPVEIEKITIVNRGRQRLEKFEDEVLSKLRQVYPSVEFQLLAKEGRSATDFASSLRSELGTSNAIFCCTPSTEPLFSNTYLKPRVGEAPKQRFICLIGSYKPHMQEVDAGTLLSGDRIWVDSKEACLMESGELIRAKVQEEQLREIGELFSAGAGSGVIVVPDGRNLILKCVGMGIMDLVVGRVLLEIAKEQNIGISVDSF